METAPIPAASARAIPAATMRPGSAPAHRRWQEAQSIYLDAGGGRADDVAEEGR
jgi:hypothetical protein